MNKFIFAALLVPFAFNVSYGQHADIEFGYDDFNDPSSIVVESDILTVDNIQIAEGSFENLFGDAFADSPGFITPADEGFRVNVGDSVSVRFLDARQSTSNGVGFVNFYDAETDQLVSNTGRIEISNQANDLVVLDGENLISSSDALVLSVGSDGTMMSNAPDEDENVILGEGEIHNHLLFDLQGDEAVGAYGLLFQFEADFADANGNIDGVVDAISAPIMVIFNNGLDDEVFETQALAAFGVFESIIGDINGDGVVDLLDVGPFVDLLSSNEFLEAADINKDGMVDLLDVGPFVDLLSGA